uniref:HMA domain-containing protein n=2 Tax=Oryza brachyantha TaxID=4533 RepID=J3N1N6_ORYBR
MQMERKKGSAETYIPKAEMKYFSSTPTVRPEHTAIGESALAAYINPMLVKRGVKRRVEIEVLLAQNRASSPLLEQQMGEEQKEPVKEEQAEKKEAAEEKKPDEPQEIIFRVDMHCEGCAKKVEKSLLRFEGVENVKADSRSKTVVVKSRTTDPAKLCERVQRKTKRRVELISPLPPPPEEEKKEEAPPPPPEENKEEPPKTVTVILKVQMHCDACAQLLQTRISKIEGVESVEIDLPNDQVIVKGVMDQAVLIDSIQRKTRRPAVVIVEEEKQAEEDQKKPEEEAQKAAEVEKKADGINEVKRYDFWPPVQYHAEYVYPYLPPPPLQHGYPYPPPVLASEEFSDENPNACTIL